MNFKTIIAGLVAASAALTAPATASATIGLLKENVTVDSRSTLPSATSKKLVGKVNYLVTVKGTASFVGQPLWNQPAGSYFVTCGSTAPITYPSPGQSAGVAGVDAETLFAGIAVQGCGNFVPPVIGGFFTQSGDGGATFANPTPIGGAPLSPDGASTYTYVLKGEGKVAKFLIADGNRTDNNGVFQVQVRVASNLACLGDGWKTFDAFASRAECMNTLDPFGAL